MLINANSANKKGLVYPELSYKITGLIFKIQNDMGRLCREKQYCDRLEKLLQENNIKYKREAVDNDGDRFDFLIEDIMVLEIKAKQIVIKEDYYQLKRYLEINNLKLGLLVNFRNRYLKPKRILNSKID